MEFLSISPRVINHYYIVTETDSEQKLMNHIVFLDLPLRLIVLWSKVVSNIMVHSMFIGVAEESSTYRETSKGQFVGSQSSSFICEYMLNNA